MSVATSADISWSVPPPLVTRSSTGVLLGEWPCTFTGWHRAACIGQGFTAWVYTLVDSDDQVCYVGQTGELLHRLGQHGRNKAFAWWYAFGTVDRMNDERRQIEACAPYLLSDGRAVAEPSAARVVFRHEILAGGR